MYTVSEILDIPEKVRIGIYSGSEYDFLETIQDKNALEENIVDDTLKEILLMTEGELYESLKDKGLYKKDMPRGEGIVVLHGYLTFPLTKIPKDILQLIINQSSDASKFAW